MLAMCVVVPGAVGIGGYGGSAVIFDASSKGVTSVDFDSRAPLALRAGDVSAARESSYYGARAVTVPSVIAGLDLILREFGSKPWSTVLRPAVQLAEEGFQFDAEHERQLKRCAPKFDRESLESLVPGGQVPAIGFTWKQPSLARLLHQLSSQGARAFYEGDIPQAIVGFLRPRGGILDENDFHSYRPQIVETVQACCGEFDLFTPPPPSGGITSLAVVETMEALTEECGDRGSPSYFHFLAEAMKLCWHDRHDTLGDPDFVPFSVERHLSTSAVESRVRKIRSGEIIRGPSLANSSPHTANVIAADPAGNLISLTATQGWMYGSHLVVGDLGLVLNHGMSRFDHAIGHPNAPAAGKRMQHNMSPTIATKNGRPAFALGLPGGPKIVTATSQLILDTMMFCALPAVAIAAPLIHTDGDEPLLVSSSMPDSIVAELEKRGHTVRREADMGGPVNLLAIDAESNTIDIASGEGTGAVAGF
jgi:gamma-glutamyltranspeptidase/glutathione hydrolase